MSDADDGVALLLTSVMAEIYSIRLGGRNLLEDLSRRAADGERTAKDIMRNPWNTAVPAIRAIPKIETELNALRDTLRKTGPAFLAAWLQERQLADQLEFHRLREHGRLHAASEGTTDALERGHRRIIDILIQSAGVTNRDGERVSVDAVIRAGRLIKRQAKERWCDEIVSWKELSQADLLPRVCVLHGWSIETGELRDFDVPGVLWHYDPVQDTWREEIDPHFNSSRYHTALPIPVTIDPPDMPRDWAPDSAVEMHPVLWDALSQDKFYRSFVRELEDGENLAFNWDSNWPEYEPMPRHATLDAMIRFDERFKGCYRRAEMRFRVLDGHRAELEDVTLEDLARSPRRKTHELLEFAAPVASAVLFDVEKWDTWRPWGILLTALKFYLETSPDDPGAPGSLVFAWAYFLKARLAESDDDLPVFVREALFDWMMLPVSSTLTPAVRILVPRDRLKAQVESAEMETGNGEKNSDS